MRRFNKVTETTWTHQTKENVISASNSAFEATNSKSEFSTSNVVLIVQTASKTKKKWAFICPKTEAKKWHYQTEINHFQPRNSLPNFSISNLKPCDLVTFILLATNAALRCEQRYHQTKPVRLKHETQRWHKKCQALGITLKCLVSFLFLESAYFPSLLPYF